MPNSWLRLCPSRLFITDCDRQVISMVTILLLYAVYWFSVHNPMVLVAGSPSEHSVVVSTKQWTLFHSFIVLKYIIYTHHTHCICTHTHTAYVRTHTHTHILTHTHTNTCTHTHTQSYTRTCTNTHTYVHTHTHTHTSTNTHTQCHTNTYDSAYSHVVREFA